MLDLTPFQRLARLHAAGERITRRVMDNPSLLSENALCVLLERITQLMLKIGRGYLVDAPVPDDDWGYLDELSDEWDEDKDVHS